MISPDTYAIMLATIDAGDQMAGGNMSSEQVVLRVNALLKAGDLEVEEYCKFLPAVV